MRPFLLVMVMVVIAVAAFAQQPMPLSGCFYGCGPYVPRITTPEISFQQVSPNPVGASNATTGLTAGATNSTLSEINGSTSSVYTVPVWYQGGGAPLLSPEIRLWPEPIGHAKHPMHPMREEHAREERGARKEERVAWTYYAGPGEEYTGSPAEAAAPGKGSRQAGHVYGNDDVKRQNDQNGVVKYRGKTEKI